MVDPKFESSKENVLASWEVKFLKVAFKTRFWKETVIPTNCHKWAINLQLIPFINIPIVTGFCQNSKHCRPKILTIRSSNLKITCTCRLFMEKIWVWLFYPLCSLMEFCISGKWKLSTCIWQFIEDESWMK